MAGNPISANAQVHHSMTDPQVNASLNGKINFSTLADVVLQILPLKGVITANVNMAVKVSQIEEDYDNIKVDGLVVLQNRK